MCQPRLPSSTGAVTQRAPPILTDDDDDDDDDKLAGSGRTRQPTLANEKAHVLSQVGWSDPTLAITVLLVASFTSLQWVEWWFRIVLGSWRVCFCFCCAFGWRRQPEEGKAASLPKILSVRSSLSLENISDDPQGNMSSSEGHSSCWRSNKRSDGHLHTEFCPPGHIQALSLQDTATILTYAADVELVEDQEDPLALVKQAILETTNENPLRFWTAAVRVFSEWRLLRLIPPSAHAYRTTMNFSHQDLVANLRKIELALDVYRERHDKDAASWEELLEDEIEQGLHPQLPKLHDGSGANGLLWISRQIQFQAQIFRGIPIQDAYRQVYAPFHGFWVGQLFRQSLRSAPSTRVVLKHMRSYQPCNREKQEQYVVRTECVPTKDIDNKNPLEEWMHELTTRFILPCQGGKSPSRSKGVASVSPNVGESTTDVESWLNIVDPVLKDLKRTFTQLNMNDPSKV